MLGRKILEEMSKKISEVLEASPVKDIEKNIRAILSSTLSRLDMVTRKEFDLQQEMLVHTRKAIDQVCVRLDKIDSELNKIPFTKELKTRQVGKNIKTKAIRKIVQSKNTPGT